MPREYYVYPNGTPIAVAGNNEYATQIPMSANDATDVYTAISGKADNTSLPASQGGTDLTLVTTGDKYNWDNNDASSKVSKSGDTMTGTLTMAGQDIVLGTTGSSSDDSGDIVWKYGDGTEKMRIWSDNSPTTTSGPRYRVYKSDGTSLYSGYLALGNSDGMAITANTVNGIYTLNGGQQGPAYFGKNRVGFLMSNATVNGDAHYKNWIYMDNYSGSDVGGTTAIGVDRMEAKAFIMQSDASRSAWNNSAEIFTTKSTVPIANGGTGATTAANARTNLAVPYMYTDSYPTLQQPGGGNSWIKIGTSNTSYGLLPSASGGASAGHNYIGTSSWYWRYAYIQDIYGKLNGASTSCSGNAATATKSTYASLTYAGASTGTASKNYTIPSDASELIFTAYMSGVNKIFSSSVPKSLIATNVTYELWVGGGKNEEGTANAGAARALCNVKLNGTTLTVTGVVANNAGSQVTSSTTFGVYYR